MPLFVSNCSYSMPIPLFVLYPSLLMSSQPLNISHHLSLFLPLISSPSTIHSWTVLNISLIYPIQFPFLIQIVFKSFFILIKTSSLLTQSINLFSQFFSIQQYIYFKSLNPISISGSLNTYLISSSILYCSTIISSFYKMLLWLWQFFL